MNNVLLTLKITLFLFPTALIAIPKAIRPEARLQPSENLSNSKAQKAQQPDSFTRLPMLGKLLMPLPLVIQSGQIKNDQKSQSLHRLTQGKMLLRVDGQSHPGPKLKSAKNPDYLVTKQDGLCTTQPLEGEKTFTKRKSMNCQESAQ